MGPGSRPLGCEPCPRLKRKPSRSYRLLERGVSFGAIVINQRNHVFLHSRHAKPSDVSYRPDSQCQMRKEKSGLNSSREVLSGERRAVNWRVRLVFAALRKVMAPGEFLPAVNPGAP